MTRCRMFLVLALLIAAGTPVTADWLSLRDGTEIETDGRWSVTDGRVTFKLDKRSGIFSVPSERVDLARSEELTRSRMRRAERPAAPPAVEPQRRAPVLVLTDGDVRKVKRDKTPVAAPAPPASRAPAGAEAPAASPRRLAQGLEVVSWRVREDDGGGAVVVEGEVRNKGKGLAIGLDLVVSLTDGERGVVESRSAQLGASTLAPLQKTRFRAEFTGPVDFDEVHFEMGPGEIARVHIRDLFGGAEDAAGDELASG